jgi:hypothetical protein
MKPRVQLLTESSVQDEEGASAVAHSEIIVNWPSRRQEVTPYMKCSEPSYTLQYTEVKSSWAAQQVNF